MFKTSSKRVLQKQAFALTTTLRNWGTKSDSSWSNWGSEPVATGSSGTRLGTTVAEKEALKEAAAVRAQERASAGVPERRRFNDPDSRDPIHVRFADASFVEQVIALKGAYRGKAQRPGSLADAHKIFGKIPKDIDGWISEENAAYALNGLGFFEIDIPQKEAIIQWTVKNVTSFKSPRYIIFACLGLNQLFVTSDEAINATKEMVPKLVEQVNEMKVDEFHSLTKLLQRIHYDDKATWDKICVCIRQRWDEINLSTSTTVRLFACCAREAPDHDVTRHLFKTILATMQHVVSYDVTAFIKATEKWSLCTLSDLLTILKRSAGRVSYNNARDLGVSFPAVIRLSHGMMPKLTTDQLCTLAEHLDQVFDECESQLEIFMDPKNKELYWRRPEDIISALFAYESSGRRPEVLFNKFETYCLDLFKNMTPKSIGVSMGILRRVRRLSDNYLTKCTDRALELLKQDPAAFTVEEMSHLALCCAKKNAEDPKKPFQELLSIIEAQAKTAAQSEDPAVYGRGGQAKEFTVINLAMVFESCAQVNISLTSISGRHLADLYANSVTSKREVVTAEIASRINEGRLNGQEILLMAELTDATTNADLDGKIQAAMSDMLDEPVWGPWHIDILNTVKKENKEAYLGRAVDRAKSSVVTGHRFTHASRVLLKCFPGEETAQAFWRNGAEDMAKTNYRAVLDFVKYVVLPDTGFIPDASFVETIMKERLAEREVIDGDDAVILLQLVQRVPQWNPLGSDAKRRLLMEIVSKGAADASPVTLLHLVQAAGSVSSSLVPRTAQQALAKVSNQLPVEHKATAAALISGKVISSTSATKPPTTPEAPPVTPKVTPPQVKESVVEKKEAPTKEAPQETKAEPEKPVPKKTETKKAAAKPEPTKAPVKAEAKKPEPKAAKTAKSPSKPAPKASKPAAKASKPAAKKPAAKAAKKKK